MPGMEVPHKERQLHFDLYRLIGGAMVAVLEEDVTLYNLGLPLLVCLRSYLRLHGL